MAARINVKYKEGIDSRGEAITKKIKKLMDEGFITPGRIDSIEVIDSYSTDKELAGQETAEKLYNPVTQQIQSDFPTFDYAIEIGFKPGVTDNVGTTAGKATVSNVYSSQVLLIKGELTDKIAEQIGETLANPLIQTVTVSRVKEIVKPYIPRVILNEEPKATTVPIRTMSQERLVILAKEGITDPKTCEHRGPLALDEEAMRTIKGYFKKINRDPTDIELECLAQTWSEHCKHTIFAAYLDRHTCALLPRGLFKTYIQGATETIIRKWKMQGKENFLLSVFRDNSGIIKFDDNWAITDKVETHNSPSALDPYGGAITGIVGVDRDAIGAGMGAMPFNHRFYFCFADPKHKRQLFKNKNKDGTLENKILSHRSIMDGVIAGVKDGGNKSGIPTPQGGVFFHESYSGKPLVFVGVQGLLPLKVAEKPGWEKKAQPGDLIVMVGGRVGIDGIHGATFSSEAMHSGSPTSSVQIGNPIMQKKLSDAIVKEARELGLYNSITDNGAGGLSCSVYEMAKECGGATLHLNKVPLKYPGMRPDQIIISESQERMTLAIPRENIDDFMNIMEKHDIEATVIGEFNNSGRCTATFNKETVLDIDINFLHDGLPRKELKTTLTPELYRHEEPLFAQPENLTGTLHAMLARLNICSKEFIFEQFDHEVQGGSVIKPMAGKGKVDSDATITRPVLNSLKGVAATQALYPRYGEINTYHMAACAIDTAIRNMIAVGGKLEKMALLDNFCWCSSYEPERLGQLREAARACYDYAVDYMTPFISGKDSMFNTFKGYDEKGNAIKIDVLPTLLISGLSIIPDVRKCQTPEAKVAGDLVYIIGTTKDELGGSEYYAMIGEKENKNLIGNNIPHVNTKQAIKTYKCMEETIDKMLIASCISVSLGGLGVALAKVAIGGQAGMDLNLENMRSENIKRADNLLFSETQSRFIVTVNPAKKEEFEKHFKEIPLGCIGRITDNDEFIIKYGKEVIRTSTTEMTESYKKTLREY